MNFASPEYPVFLLAVFFAFALLRGSAGRAGAVLRGAAVLALGDLVYLLLTRDLASLWDPLGALLFRPLIEHAPAARPATHYALGAVVFAASALWARQRGEDLERPRGQRATALVFTVAVLAVGALVGVGARAGALPRVTGVLARGGHLGYLAALGVAVGAAGNTLARHAGRHVWLFVASAVFYHAWAAGMPGAYKYLLGLIVGTITLDYYLALWIADARAPWARRALLVLSLVSNLGVLVLFKYYAFFANSTRAAAAWFGLSLRGHTAALILPAGISFHTFQSLSYTLDVYRGGLRPTRSILRFGVFVLFFPQLVAGPIVRAEEFLPQLEHPRAIDPERAAAGLFRIAVGLFKKVALADYLAVLLVDRVFERPGVLSGLEVLCGVYAYALQIYLDFSAYSDIAIGSAALLGFTFPENFASPYRAADLSEFWRRWHITLSSWLRDYVYIPLGGSRGAPWRTYRNLLATMLLGGLWHGASWTFLVWGALHGGGLAVTRWFQRLGARSRARRDVALGVSTVAAVVCAVLHRRGVGHGAIAALARRAGGVDPAWVHLAWAWAYLTPAWMGWTAVLAPGEPPGVAGEGAAATGAWGRAAGALRVLFAAASVGVAAALYRGGGRGTLGLIAAWWLFACASEVCARAPDGASARRWATWLARRTAAGVLTVHYVCFAWVFFRAPTFADARNVLAQIATGSRDAGNLAGPVRVALALAAAAHLVPAGTFRRVREGFVALPWWGRAVALTLCALELRQLARPLVVPFIYFQF